MRDVSFLNHELPGLQIAKYLIELLQKYKSVCHPLFIHRLLREEQLPHLPDTSHISDLGLRRTSEPTHFFMENAVICLKKCPYEIGAIVQYQDYVLGELLSMLGYQKRVERFHFDKFVSSYIRMPSSLNGVMTYYADVLGSWVDADQIADHVVQHMDRLPSTESTASLLTNCGNLFAHRGNAQCRQLYSRAIDLWEDAYQQFTTHFRLAVAEVKRLNDAETMETAILNAKSAAADYGLKTRNPANTIFFNGLIANLEALYFLKNGDLATAGEQIHRAWKDIASISADEIDIESDIAARYRMQIIENLALYYGLIKDWTRSVAIFREAVALSRKIHIESLAEALAKYGYALLQMGMYDEAIQALLEAEKIKVNSITIDKLREVRKMLAVAYYEWGQHEESVHWVKMSKFKNYR